LSLLFSYCYYSIFSKLFHQKLILLWYIHRSHSMLYVPQVSWALWFYVSEVSWARAYICHVLFSFCLMFYTYNFRIVYFYTYNIRIGPISSILLLPMLTFATFFGEIVARKEKPLLLFPSWFFYVFFTLIFGIFWYFVLQYPVYFAFENDEIETVLADIKNNDAIGQPATATTGGLVESLLFKTGNSAILNILVEYLSQLTY